MNENGSNAITLKTIANGIHKDWELKDWFEWPPNMFALISVVLQRTGCYRICLQNTEWWENKDWQSSVNNNANLWLQYSNSLIMGDYDNANPANNPFEEEKYYPADCKLKILKSEYKKISDNWDEIDLTRLRIVSDLHRESKSGIENKKNEETVEFAISLLKVLAVADRSCSGVGLVGETNPDMQHTKLFAGVANLLLNNTGSLSTIPKFFGVVLPKMRTPQSGMSLRSLSHHLTFHITEVEVMWRTFPWMNNHKPSLNILAIPYPEKIDEENFNIVAETYHSVRYFRANVTDEASENQTDPFLDSIINAVYKCIEKKKAIDVLVFPETALNKARYNALLKKLTGVQKYFKDRKTFIQLPIIIAGVMSSDGDQNASAVHFHNEVRMATYFADKWYEIRQGKHHRWNLDREQILQYRLEGYFSTERTWFEQCSISQRRLSILAPNAWLALTTLICEDLARQEPVSDVIRGIGPTLLFALLSDGPQLTNRWSARYASVLADDPGTAVLSITSEGMVARSRKINTIAQQQKDMAKDAASNSTTIGLWKDMIKGWKELEIINGEGPKALFFTISSIYKEEFTLDGRTDYSNASVFRMDSIDPVQINLNEPLDPAYKKSEPDENRYGSWDDIRELSAACFSIDVIIDLLQLFSRSKPDKKFIDGIDKLLDLLQPQPDNNHRFRFLAEIKKNISDSWKHPHSAGIEATLKETDRNDHLEQFIAKVKEIVSMVILAKDCVGQVKYYNLLVDSCAALLEKIFYSPKEEDRIQKLTLIAFMFSLNTKLSYRKNINHTKLKGGVSIKEAQEIIIKIQDLLSKYQ